MHGKFKAMVLGAKRRTHQGEVDFATRLRIVAAGCGYSGRGGRWSLGWAAGDFAGSAQGGRQRQRQQCTARQSRGTMAAQTAAAAGGGEGAGWGATRGRGQDVKMKISPGTAPARMDRQLKLASAGETLSAKSRIVALWHLAMSVALLGAFA